MRPRKRLQLEVVLILSCLSLVCSVIFIFSTMHQFDKDELLRNSEVNNDFNGVPSLEGEHIRANEISPNLEFKNFGKEQGRVLQAFPRLNVKPWKQERRFSILPEQNPPRIPVLKGNQLLGCEDMKRIQVVDFIGRGYTKLVQKAIYKGVQVAIKSIAPEGEDIKRCISNPSVNRSIDECFLQSKYKLAKEIIMLQELQHQNIIKLLGFCWQNEMNTADLRTRGLTMVTEIGVPLDVIRIVQLPWQERLKICVGMARLLHYLAHSPLGSLIIRDFQLTQFVLVSGELKLTDLDDVDNLEPGCRSDDDCIVQISRENNKTLSCDRGQCKGFNAAKNLAVSNRNLFRYVLLPGAPKSLHSYLQAVKDGLETLSLDSELLVVQLEKVVDLLTTGQHYPKGTFSKTSIYKQLSDADFPNMHDYHCANTRSFDACEIAVYSVAEAKYTCDKDERCKAFVVTTRTLWSGYTIVYLKNKTTDIKPHKDTTVYLKLPT